MESKEKECFLSNGKAVSVRWLSSHATDCRQKLSQPLTFLQEEFTSTESYTAHLESDSHRDKCSEGSEATLPSEFPIPVSHPAISGSAYQENFTVTYHLMNPSLFLLSLFSFKRWYPLNRNTLTKIVILLAIGSWGSFFSKSCFLDDLKFYFNSIRFGRNNSTLPLLCPIPLVFLGFFVVTACH